MEIREPAVAYGRRKYSIEEYLEIEEAAIEKHEYYQGEIFDMAGAKHEHNLVLKNLYFALGNKLKGKPCQPFSSDTRIHIEKNSLFTYPDISVICGDPVYRNNDDLNLLNPTVIIEVLSPSTKSYDQGEKFALYRDIPTLKEYIIADPDKIKIAAYHINSGGHWELREYKSMEEVLQLKSIKTTVKLNVIYEGTKAGKGLSL